MFQPAAVHNAEGTPHSDTGVLLARKVLSRDWDKLAVGVVAERGLKQGIRSRGLGGHSHMGMHSGFLGC